MQGIQANGQDSYVVPALSSAVKAIREELQEYGNINDYRGNMVFRGPFFIDIVVALGQYPFYIKNTLGIKRKK